MANNIDNSFDEDFNRLKTIHWLPWVGKDYLNSPSNRKLLILGESHYVPADEDFDGYSDREWTRIFIRKEGLQEFGQAINPLVANTERAIFNTKAPADTDKNKLWHSSAYFNLVQRLLTSRDENDRPTDSDFHTGWEAFLSVVDIIKPSICLILGKSGFGPLGYYLNNNKTNWQIHVPKLNSKEKVILLSKEEYNIKLIFIKHPSSYFSWKGWAEVLERQIPEVTNAFRNEQ